MNVKNIKEKCKKIKGKLNNEGSSIVLVIVIMSLMGILVTMALYMCVANFYMKSNDRMSKNNFYSAETVLDEIRTGIQAQASAAVDTAYMDVIQNYDGKTPEDRKQKFILEYVDSIRNTFKDGTDKAYKLDMLKSYVKNVPVMAAGDDFSNYVGAEITIADGKTNDMVAYTSAVVLRNIKVRYRDSKGYVSVITTDIRIEIPEISFESSYEIPEIISYSLIAADKLTIKNTFKSTISGSVYGGREGIVANGNSRMYFKEAPAVITSGLVTVSDGADITMDKDTTLWAGGTLLAGGQADSKDTTLNLLGSAYVKDDTTLTGVNNALKVNGKYLGFGNSKVGAENSSAIIINGTKSKVDISSMDRLLLPGNAYIGINKDPTEVDGTQLVDQSVGLGESLTAKASQIAYLVPPECIGYVDGKCVLGTNPVQYSKLQSAFVNASGTNKLEVDYSKISNNSADYAGATFKRKFVRYNNGTGATDALVYYYVVFESGISGNEQLEQKMAAEFFQKYFSKNEENIRKYLDIYVDTLNIDGVKRLNIAGNLIKKVEETDEDGNVVKDKDGNTQYKYELIDETQSADNAAGTYYDTEVETYKNVFKGLTTKLVKQGAEISESSEEYKNVYEQDASGNYTKKGIFDNLVNKTVFDKIVNNQDTTATHKAEFANDSEGVKAIVIDGDYTIDNETPNTTSLLIASGNVSVERAFKGTIISGGTITINFDSKGDGSAVDINHDRDMVRHVLDIEKEFTAFDGSKFSVSPMDLFDPSLMNISSVGENGKTTDKIVIEDLVNYENWTKQ